MKWHVAWVVFFSALVACSESLSALPSESFEGEGEDGGGDGDVPLCAEPTAVRCFNDVFASLQLQLGAVSRQSIDNTPITGGIAARVSLSPGPGAPFLYARFTADGLVAVDLEDAVALDSMDWDIAFRGNLIRLNGGDSGPSCVSAALVDDEAAFEEVGAPHADAVWRGDIFFDESCAAATVGTAVAGWWQEESGCFVATQNNYWIQLRSGTILVLSIDAVTTTNETLCAAGTSTFDALDLRWRTL
jgi:hypothetical protein